MIDIGAVIAGVSATCVGLGCFIILSLFMMCCHNDFAKHHTAEEIYTI